MANEIENFKTDLEAARINGDPKKTKNLEFEHTRKINELKHEHDKHILRMRQDYL